MLWMPGWLALLGADRRRARPAEVSAGRPSLFQFDWGSCPPRRTSSATMRGVSGRRALIIGGGVGGVARSASVYQFAWLRRFTSPWWAVALGVLLVLPSLAGGLAVDPLPAA